VAQCQGDRPATSRNGGDDKIDGFGGWPYFGVTLMK
jgi:hypothetical protein